MMRMLALIAGALIPLSLAPFNYWWTGPIALAALAACLQHSSPRESLLRGWLFGSGSFLAGVSWIYVAMYVYGNTSAALSALMTGLFCLALGLVTGLFAYSYSRFLRTEGSTNILGFAAAWVIFEWFRGWFMTGFPWLYLGYAHVSTPLSGWGPIVGIYGLSFWTALSGAALYVALREVRSRPLSATLPLLCCGALMLQGQLLTSTEWTQLKERPPLRIGAVQANISQDKKWDYTHYWKTLELYDTQSEKLWADADLVIWPEAAIPALYHHALPFFDYIRERAQANNSALITGVPTRDDEDMYNSVMVISGGEGTYHKQRLVPFGEYVPLAQYIRGLISFFDLPMSSFSWGGPDQGPLQVKDWLLAPSICYEIVYPDLVARSARNADVLFTISNDAWFGKSIGPAQHMEMAQMRALENGRELIRVTGTGITAITDHRGQIKTRIPAHEQALLRGAVSAREGQTPFNRLGSTPIIAGCFLLIAVSVILRRRQPSRKI